MILGIDPGNEQSGYVVVDNYKVIDAGKIKNEKLLVKIIHIPAFMRDVDAVCIELIQSYGSVAGRTLYDTCIWTGRFIQALAHAHLHVPIHLYTRPKIMRAIVGTNKGGDRALRATLLLRFGGDKKGEPMHPLRGGGGDLRAAYAAVVYHMDGAKLGEW